MGLSLRNRLGETKLVTMKLIWSGALACAFMMSSPHVAHGENLRLSFDQVENPLPPFQITADTAPAATAVTVPDSVKIAAGLVGKGLLFTNSCDFLEITGKTILSPDAGAVSFWMKTLNDNSKLDRRPLWFAANFTAGKIVLADNLKISVLDEDGKWCYSPQETCNPAEPLKSGEWHFVVVNWDAAKGTKQLFVDGQAYPFSEFSPPGGALKGLFFSLASSNQKGNPTSCVYDEILIYDKPLGEMEVRKAWADMPKNEAPPTMRCPPNLLAGKTASFTPKPNYQWQGAPRTPIISCNTSDNAEKLTDGIYGTAYCYSPETVGWMGTPTVKIDFDLGDIKKIDTIGINIGLGGGTSAGKSDLPLRPVTRQDGASERDDRQPGLSPQKPNMAAQQDDPRFRIE